MAVLLTQLLIGFSVTVAPVLVVAYIFFLPQMEKSVVGRVASVLLLGSLTALQLHHLTFLDSGVALFELRSYVFCLLATPPAFFFFCREVLVPGCTRSWLHLLHFAPLTASFFVSATLIAPLAFVIGALYSIWFALFVFGMRRHVHRFRFEMFFFSFFAVLAVLVLLLAIVAPTLGNGVFYVAYANFTGVAFLVIVAAMIIYPDMLADFSAAARLSYANSTLGSVDIAAKLRDLDATMSVDLLFQNEDLTLGMLAKAVDLSPHQLSEMINTQFGFGFSRYVREQRVREAKQQLLRDPDASILSVGLATGFRSQSTFYAAFRELVGESPGAWRQRKRGAGS